MIGNKKNGIGKVGRAGLIRFNISYFPFPIS